MRKIFLFILPLMIFPGAVHAESIGTAGTCTGNFLLLSTHARASGMADAFGGIVDDVNAYHWNPAGLAQLPFWQIGAMYNKYISEISFSALSFAVPVKKAVIGAHYLYFDEGSMQGTDLNGPTGVNLIANDQAFGCSAALGLFRGFSIGTNVKLIRSTLGLAEYSDTGMAMDFGFLLVRSKFNLGFSMQNIVASKLTYWEEPEELPKNYLAALGCNFGNLNLDCDLNFPSNANFSFGLGGEYWFKNLLALRGGYNYSANNKETKKIGLTGGAGCRLKDIQIDYAFVPYGNLGNTHLLSLTYNFGVVSEERVAERQARVEELRRLKREELRGAPKERVRKPRRARKRAPRVKKARKPRREKVARRPRRERAKKVARKPKKERVIPAVSVTERQMLLEKLAHKVERKKFEVKSTAKAITITLPTHFKFGDPALQSKDKTKFTTLAKLLKKYPELEIRIQTHTAGKGSSQFKIDLTQRQAENIKEFFVSKGVPEENISPKGYGETRPIGDLLTEEGKAKSCRVEFVIF